MVYSTRRFVLCLTLCCFIHVFFSPFSIGITSLGEERTNLSAFRTFVRFALVWFCLFPLPLGVWEGLRFVIVALSGLFFYLFFVPSEDRSAWASASLISVFATWRKLGSLATRWTLSNDSDQTRRMTRLIWIFAGRTSILLVLSCAGSYGSS